MISERERDWCGDCDCDHYGDVCSAFDAKHRPYVGWFRGGALRSHYDGAHTSDAFLAWAASDV